MRYLFIVKANQGPEPTPALMEAMHKMAQREIQAGRMLDDGGLAPLAMGCQVSVERGELKVLDGPFIEAKEMIGGYAVFDLPGPAEALAFPLQVTFAGKRPFLGLWLPVNAGT